MFNFDPNLGMTTGGGCIGGGFGFGGGSVEVKTTGEARSIFNGGPTQHTEITVKNGPTGGWGIALGVLSGLFGGGGILPGVGDYASPYGMLNQLNGYAGSGQIVHDPQAARFFGLNNLGFNFGQTNGLGFGGQQMVNPQLSGLSTLASGAGWSVIQNPDGTFSATKSGQKGVTGTYEEVRDKLMAYNESQPEKKEDNETKA